MELCLVRMLQVEMVSYCGIRGCVGKLQESGFDVKCEEKGVGMLIPVKIP